MIEEWVISVIALESWAVKWRPAHIIYTTKYKV